ncbi:MAG: hypothetical protein GW898_12130 [Thiomicrospira sp.]|nr:hypothetical protein [Thiomicrospira sp.]
MKVTLSASAEEDLLDGFQFYERQQRHLGAYFLDSRQNPARIHAKLSGRI